MRPLAGRIAYPMAVAVVVFSAVDVRPAGSQPCPWPVTSAFYERIAVSPCNNDPNLPSGARLRYDGTIRDRDGDPISGSTTILMNFSSSCGGPSNVNFYTDEPSDASGNVFWMENLSSQYGVPGCGPVIADDGCGLLDVIEPYHAQNAPAAGLRNVDQQPDGDIDLQDFGFVQRAFVGQEPIYRGDFTRDDVVALGDVSLFQQHFVYCNLDDAAPAPFIPSGFSGALDRPFIYVHVVDRLGPDEPIPVVFPDHAVNLVESVGPDGREITVIVFAIDYGAFQGVQVGLAWPDAWQIEKVHTNLLEGQLIAYPDPGIYDESYATVFNCIQGGAPVPVGRIDMRATVPGAVSLRRSMPPRIVDCDLQERVLALDRGSSTSTTPQTGHPLRLVRTSPITGREGGAYRLVGPLVTPVAAVVYDVSGRAVRRLAIESVDGDHVITWDGRKEDGGTASSGVYLISVRAGAVRLVERGVAPFPWMGWGFRIQPLVLVDGGRITDVGSVREKTASLEAPGSTITG